MLKIITILIFLLSCGHLCFSQEICDNGKDDDNDGLIDLNDFDCMCRDSLPGSNYFQNPSFEVYSKCPMGYGTNDDTIVQGWFCARKNKGNCDLFYLNDQCSDYQTIFFGPNTGFPTPPSPFPDGHGIFALKELGSPPGTQETSIYKSYIGVCSNTTLLSNQTYLFSFFIGFGKHNQRNVPNVPQYASYSPFKIAIFGHPDCNSGFPFNNNLGGTGCPPAVSNGWVLLGNAVIYGRNQWVQGSIEFTPNQNINAIAIGPDCGEVPYFSSNGYNDTLGVFYLDQVALAPKKNYDFKYINEIAGDPCNGNYILKAPFYTNASYQWFKDGIAISNATNLIYTVTNSYSASGNYVVKIIFPDKCILSLPHNIIYPSKASLFNLGADTILCNPAGAVLSAKRSYTTQYIWNNGKTDSAINVNQPGLYWVEITDDKGCKKKDSVRVNVQDCDNCDLFVPNAFTPNNDGVNDVFRIFPVCNFNFGYYQMKIFNRWGQLIFQTSDINSKWDGTFRNKNVPIGSYIYLINYGYGAMSSSRSKAGTILVIR